ncbi:MAG: hypothetical protein IPO29_04560 [Anaerolineae bacterium]|nr:hypothetical protein [Anaerolineae bacterium]
MRFDRDARPRRGSGQTRAAKDAWLVEPVYGRNAPIRDGIPIMLVEEGDKWIGVKVEDLPVPPPAE